MVLIESIDSTYIFVWQGDSGSQYAKMLSLYCFTNNSNIKVLTTLLHIANMGYLN